MVVPDGAGFKGARFSYRFGKASWKARKVFTRTKWNKCRSSWRNCGKKVGGGLFNMAATASIGGDWDNAKSAGRFWCNGYRDTKNKLWNIGCDFRNKVTRGLYGRCSMAPTRQRW